jgi:hypothetical protein
MSTGPSRSGSPIRQQLDDLDALLERMLDLPGRRDAARKEEQPQGPAQEADVSQETTPGRESLDQRPQPEDAGDLSEVPGQPPAPQTPASLLSSYRAGRPSGPPPPAPSPPAVGTGKEEDDQWVPLRPQQGWQPSAHTWGPLAESWRMGQVDDLPPPAANPSREGPERTPPPVPPASLAVGLGPEGGQEPPGRPESVEWPPPEPSPALPADSAPAEERGVPEEDFSSWSPPLPSPVPAQPGQEEELVNLPAPPAEVPAPQGSVPAWLGPLVWVNRGFEAGAHFLGPPGRWLASPSGRTVLGTAGLFALGMALVLLLLRGIGWTG